MPSPETTDREVVCLACSAPLSGREGKFVLKYFLYAKRTGFDFDDFIQRRYRPT
jgi:hypothetical protein